MFTASPSLLLAVPMLPVFAGAPLWNDSFYVLFLRDLCNPAKGAPAAQQCPQEPGKLRHDLTSTVACHQAMYGYVFSEDAWTSKARLAIISFSGGRDKFTPLTPRTTCTAPFGLVPTRA